jgi:hypothetical protein
MLTNKQLSYIRVLEQKSNLKFTGTTTKDMSRFVDHANQIIRDRKIISSKVKREHEKFPFPDLTNDLPTDKQRSFIKLLEYKTKLKFDGVTRADAKIYIDYAKGLIEGV